jgi:hypothetical protein
MITTGKYTTYDSPFLDELVKGIAVMIDPKLTTSLDLFPEFEPINTTKIKWYDAKTYSLEGEVADVWNDTDTTGLAISAQFAQLVNVGDVLRIWNEFVVVKSVNRTGNTVDLYGRGHGGTTAAGHVATSTIFILGNANVEGTVNGDSLLEDSIEQINFTQIIEEPIEITLTAQKQKYLDVTDKLNDERMKAMTRALKKLNQAVLFGRPSAGSKTTPRSFGGLKHFIENTSGAFNYNVAGAFTETHLKNVLLEMARRGGSPTTILCSPDIKSVINGFNASNTRYGRDERIAGNFIDRYEGEGVGVLDIVADPFLRHSFGEIYVVNTNKLGKTWFVDDKLRFEAEPANSRTLKETLQVQLTVRVKDVVTDCARMYGIS